MNILDNVVDLYVRVSTTEQAEEGFSVGAQEEKLRAYCKAYNYQINAVHVDPGFSGATMDRPALKQVIRDVENNHCKKVIVWKLDRLSRSQKDTLILLEDVFAAHDCHFVSLMESFDTSTPIGRCMVGILAAFAQMERENIKVRTAMGRQARVKQGHYSGNKPPIGYAFNTASNGNIISNDLIVDPYNAKIVQDIFKWYLEGYSLNGIAKRLADAGAGSYAWQHSTSIRRILSNPVYIGKVKLNNELYEGMHEPLISESDFNEVSCMLAHQRELHKRPAASYQTKNGCRSANLLSGLLYCGDCGARMYARKVYKGSSIRKYMCYSVAKTAKSMIRSDCCTNREHPYTVEQLDEIVLNEIKKLALDKAQFSRIASKSDTAHEEDAKVYNERLEELNKQIKRLMNLYQTGIIDLADISDRLQALNNEKLGVQSRLDELKEADNSDAKLKAWEQLESFPAILDAGDVQQVHRIVNALIDKIVVLNRDVTIYWSFS